MRSIRRTLTIQLLLSVGLLALVTGAGLYVHLRSLMQRDFDDELMEEVRELGGLVRWEGAGVLEFDFSERAMPEYRLGADDPEYFQIWGPRGDVAFARSPSLGERGDLSTIRAAAPAEAVPYDVVLPDGRAGRAVVLLARPVREVDPKTGAIASPPPGADDAPMTILFACARARVDQLLADLAVSFGVLGAALIGGAVAVVLFAVRAGLRPLVKVGEQAALIDAASLGHRFDVKSVPRELRPIVSRLNDLLARVERAFQRERSFTANVAHELRTPIAELRALAEVALKWPDAGTGGSGPGTLDPVAAAPAVSGATSPSTAMADVLGIAREMERIVHALLTLLRVQAGRQAVTTEHFALAPLVSDAWAPLREQAAAGGLECAFEIPDGVDVRSDPTLLSSILQNLLANAVRYTPRNGRITCAAAQAGEAVRLTIGNTNGSLVPADLPRLTEPFWRKDAARTSSAQSGLGLSIVEALCKALGIELRLDLPRDDWFLVSLTFRRSEAAGAAVG